MSPLEISQNFFNKIAPDWDAENDEPKIRRISSILTGSVPALQGPFLDVGCGTGILIPILDTLYCADEGIAELDISNEMIRRSKQKYGSKKHIRFIIGDAHQSPFFDSYFSSIICFAVFPHFHDQNKALRELLRIMKPGGILVILHLMGHKELNEMHRNAGNAVKRHALQPVELVSRQVKSHGFNIHQQAEQPDLYLIIAEKGN